MRGSGFRLPVLALSLVLSMALSAVPVHSTGAGIEGFTSASPTLSPTARASVIASPLLYIAKSDGLHVIDMGDLDTSLFYDAPGSCEDVALHGELVYAADRFAGLLILRPLY